MATVGAKLAEGVAHVEVISPNWHLVEGGERGSLFKKSHASSAPRSTSSLRSSIDFPMLQNLADFFVCPASRGALMVDNAAKWVATRAQDARGTGDISVRTVFKSQSGDIDRVAERAANPSPKSCQLDGVERWGRRLAKGKRTVTDRVTAPGIP
jgi:hypothetical protein